MHRLVLIIAGCCLTAKALAQVELNYGIEFSLEGSRAGDRSHYFYNEVHRRDVDWALDLPRVDALGELQFGEHWSLVVQLLLERETGFRPGLADDIHEYQLRVPQIHLRWSPKEAPYSVTLGQFTHPFGRFYDEQLFSRRSFVGSPLLYNYYVDLEPQIGYVADIPEQQRISTGEQLAWGSPTLYRLGYRSGLRLHWASSAAWQASLSVVNGAANLEQRFLQWDQWAVVGTFTWRPTYFMEFGLSYSHGTWLRDSPFTELLSDPAQYRQSLLGLDYQLSYSYFRLRGSLLAAQYLSPVFIPAGNSGVYIDAEARLRSLGMHHALRVEPPFLTGSFLEYRFERIGFGQFEPAGLPARQWDKPVRRHALALGYKITRWLLLRAYLATQTTDDRDWDRRQRQLRIMATFHW